MPAGIRDSWSVSRPCSRRSMQVVIAAAPLSLTLSHQGRGLGRGDYNRQGKGDYIPLPSMGGAGGTAIKLTSVLISRTPHKPPLP